MCSKVEFESQFKPYYMLALVSVAVYEGRDFSLLPTFAYELQHGHEGLSWDGRYEAIKYCRKYPEQYSLCELCGEKLHSNGWRVNRFFVLGSRGGHYRHYYNNRDDKLWRIRANVECNHKTCSAVREFFGMAFSYDNPELQYSNLMDVNDVISKRRAKAKAAHKKIIEKRFRDPQGMIDLFLAEMLMQQAIEIRKAA